MRIVAPAISSTSPRLLPGVSDLERGDGGVEVDSGFERNGEAGHRVLRVVRAEKMEVEVRRRCSPARKCTCRPEISSLTSRICRIGAGTDAEVNDLALEVAAELRDIRHRNS